MRSLKVLVVAACFIASFTAAPAAWAQWAVIDAPAIVQLIQEVQTTAQQLQTAKDQLLQAKQALQTMTGDRGMEQLLSGTVRNYLPSDWTQVTGALQGSGGFSALSADVQSIVIVQCRPIPATVGGIAARRAAAHSKLAPVERHAAGGIAPSFVECQQSICVPANSDRGNLLGRGSEKHSRSAGEDQRRDSACCKMSKPSYRFSIRRLKRKSRRCASWPGNRSSMGMASSARVFSRPRKRRWDSLRHFGRG